MPEAVYEGLGNTFAIVFDASVDEDAAKEICARLEVDGVIAATAGTEGADIAMLLRNADGSEAEISGNGLACLAQAAIDAGRVTGPTVLVDTAAGRKRVVVGEWVTVEFGDAKVEPAEDGALAVDVGNPHLVFPKGNVLQLGRAHPDVNVEVIELIRPGSTIGMHVHERGVGLTSACGSGAYASALAAREWGWVGDSVTVNQPGGVSLVDLRDQTYAVKVERCR